MRMSSSSWLPISSTTGVFRPMPGVAFLALLYIRVVSCNSTFRASDLATVVNLSRPVTRFGLAAVDRIYLDPPCNSNADYSSPSER